MKRLEKGGSDTPCNSCVEHCIKDLVNRPCVRRVSVDATTISIDKRESAIPATGVVKAQQSLFKSNGPPEPDVFSSAANLIQKQK
jgi:hypothetical protein